MGVLSSVPLHLFIALCCLELCPWRFAFSEPSMVICKKQVIVFYSPDNGVIASYIEDTIIFLHSYSYFAID